VGVPDDSGGLVQKRISLQVAEAGILEVKAVVAGARPPHGIAEEDTAIRSQGVEVLSVVIRDNVVGEPVVVSAAADMDPLIRVPLHDVPLKSVVLGLQGQVNSVTDAGGKAPVSVDNVLQEAIIAGRPETDPVKEAGELAALDSCPGQLGPGFSVKIDSVLL